MTQPLPADQFEVTLPGSPYPGLRPFEKDEWAIFFGREKMVDEVVARLICQQLIVVHGDSGCGKSSLVRAGVFARLEQEHARSGFLWRTGATQPREAPLDRLAESLADLDGAPGDDARIVEMRRVLNFGADAPAALVRLLRRGDSDHICILIDQFEELFAFARRKGAEEARLLVQCLVGLADDPPPGLYVILTMRSEFLGMCAQFPGLAEAVNDTQYLLPRMEHRDLVRAIREPASLYGGHVSVDLAERLIADAGGTQDQLPLIQHGMMMLHRRKVQPQRNPESLSAAAPDPVDPGRWRLDVTDVNGECNLRTLLSEHADAVRQIAGGDADDVVERVFRALTEINAEGQAVRRPQTFSALLAVTGAGEHRLRHVIDTFRSETASFLTPYAGAKIAPSTLIDISHEALIRAWPRVADGKTGWLGTEFQDGLIWRSLLVQAESFASNQSSILSATTAAERSQWLDVHSAAWAERYGGGWERVTNLVQASVDAGRAAKQAEESRARTKFMLASTVAGLMAALLIVFIYLNQKTSAALAQAFNASAETLWNKLDFSDDDRLSNEELNALWEVTAGRREIRSAFMAQLIATPQRSILLGKRPAPVVRAIALQWPPDQAAAVFDRIVRAITSTTNPDDLDFLAPAATAVGGQLPAESARAAFTSIESAMVSLADAEQLGALAAAAQPLASHLTTTQAETAYKTFIGAMTDATPVGALARLGTAAQAMSSRVSPELAQSHLQQAFKAVASTTRPQRLTALRPVVRGLSARLTPDAAPAALLEALAFLQGATHSVQTLIFGATALGFVEQLSPADADVGFGRAIPLLTALTQSAQLNAARNVARALASRLAPDRAQEAMLVVVKTLRTTSHPAQTAALGTVAQTLAGRLMPAQVHPTFASLVAAMKSSTDKDQLKALSSAVQFLATKVTSAEARAALPTVLKMISATDDFDRLEALASLAQALTSRLDQTQASATLPVMIRVLTSTSDPAQRAALGPTIQVLAGHMTPDQMEAVLRLLLSAIAATVDVETLDNLGAAAQTVTARMNASQAHAVFPRLMTTVNRTIDGDQLRALGSAALPLASKLTSEPAETAFRQLVTAILKTPDPETLEKLGAVARALADLMAADHVQPAFAHVLKAMTTTLDRDQLHALQSLLDALATRLTPAQAQRESDPILKRIAQTEDSDQRAAFAASVPALAGRLSAQQAQLLFDEAIDTITKTTDRTALIALGSAAQALGARLTGEQAQHAFGGILKTMEGSPERVAALGAAVRAIAEKLTGLQAQAALQPVLTAVGGTTSEMTLGALGPTANELSAKLSPDIALPTLSNVVKMMSATTNPERLQVLARAAEVLAGQVSSQQAQGVLPSVLAALTTTRDPDQAKALGSTALALGARLAAAQAQTAVLAALRAIAAITEVETLEEFTRLVQKLTSSWDGEQIEQTFLSMLAWSATDNEAKIWSKLLISRFPHVSVEHAVETLATALKFPVATAEVTAILLDGLQSSAPAAPGRAMGLDATLEWIRQTYPRVELTTPPACPAPPTIGLTCPSVER